MGSFFNFAEQMYHQGMEVSETCSRMCDILYAVVFENEKTLVFAPEKLKEMENRLNEYYPEGEELKEIMGIYSVSDRESFVYHDMKTEHLLCLMEKI